MVRRVMTVGALAALAACSDGSPADGGLRCGAGTHAQGSLCVPDDSGAGQGGTGAAGQGQAGQASQGGAGLAGAGAGGAAAGQAGAGQAGAGQAGAGQAGAGGVVAPPGPPGVSGLTPASGEYGTSITITGVDLAGPGARLTLAGRVPQTFTPDDEEVIESWSDTEIRFRYPLPAEGDVTVETALGVVKAGSFVPTWRPGQPRTKATDPRPVASLSTGPGRLLMVLDEGSPTLLEMDAEQSVERTLALGDAKLSTVRLYRGAGGQVEGVASSGQELIHLRPTATGLEASPTGVSLAGAIEVALAGGSLGATAWFRLPGGWMRARPGPDGWAVDRGPIADPEPDESPRGAGASADGSLYVAWPRDTGNFLDDMEAPSLARLSPTATGFAKSVLGGVSVDDYLTTMALEGRGDGLLINYCGSDTSIIFPSGTDCASALHLASGKAFLDVEGEYEKNRHNVVGDQVVTATCGPGDAHRVGVGTSAEAPIASETFSWPCRRVLAVEIDEQGKALPVVWRDGTAYLVEKRL